MKMINIIVTTAIYNTLGLYEKGLSHKIQLCMQGKKSDMNI